MSKENVTVLYRISGDEAISKFPNVLNMSVVSGKEVILLDILYELPLSVGNMYDFWAKRGNSGGYVLLKSPSSLVPVIGSLVQLFLEKTLAPPHIPLKQVYAFNDLSRSNLYSAQSYVSATKQITKVPVNQYTSNLSKKFALKESSDVQHDSPARATTETETESNLFSGSYSTGKVVDSKPYSDNSRRDTGHAHREAEADTTPYSDSVSDRRSRHSSGSSSSSSRGQPQHPQNSNRYGGESGPNRSSSSNFAGTTAGGGGAGGSPMSLGGINADDIASECQYSTVYYFSSFSSNCKPSTMPSLPSGRSTHCTAFYIAHCHQLPSIECVYVC